MSLNKPTYLKLKLGDDLRKVNSLPTSLQALNDLLRSLFGTTEFHLRYVDEECDLVTIASDEELQFACQTPLGPSLKIVLTPLGRSLAEPVDLSCMSSIRSMPPEVKAPAKLPPKEEAKAPEEPTPAKVLPEVSKPAPEEAPEEAKAVPEPAAHPPCCTIKGIIGAIGKRCNQGCKRDKHTHEEVMIKALVRSEVCAALGVPQPAVHHRVQCDSCEACPIVGTRYRCTVCPNYDFCEVCEAQVPHAHPFLKIKEPQQSCEPVKPQMKFVGHGTFEDKATVKPGTTAMKEWRVQNPGAAWPAGVHVRKTKGNVGFQYVPLVPVGPGEEGIIKVMLQIPNQEVACKSVFRLCTGEGQLFGDKLRVNIQATRKQSYAAELEMVKEMGFTDEQQILHFLEIHKGDVNQVIARLL